MHVIIGDQKVDLTEGSNGRLQATFTATEDTQAIRIPSDCIGTLNVNDIQLEQGTQATPFVEPSVQSEDMSGIFKDLHDLRIDIKDTQEGLSHQIVVNQEGLEQLISNTEERLDSRITLTADTWQGELSDAKRDLNNEITATARLWQTKLSDTERGLRNTIQSRADSLITLIEDTDSANFTKTEQLVNGLQSTVQGDLRSQRTQLENLISSSIESATGERSTIWQTLNSHGRQISNAQGDISKVEQTISGYSRRISDVEGKYSSIEQTVSGLNTEVNGYNGLKSRVRQMEGLIDARVTRSDVEGIIQNSGDSIWLAIGSRVQSVADNATMTGDEIISEINLSRDGARISGKNIFLDSNVTWTRDFRTRFASVMELRADQITSGTIDASQIRVINIDAGNITGQSARLLSAIFPNMNTYATIDDRGIMITGSDAWRRSHFNHTGVELFNGSGAYNKAGVIGYFKPSTDVADWGENVMNSTRAGTPRHLLGIGVNSTHDLALGFNTQTSTDRVFNPALEIRGDTGDILIHKDLVAGNQGQGIKLRTQSHRGDYGITIEKRDNFRSKLHLSEEVYLEANYGITFHARTGQRNFRMHDNNDSYQNLSMQGNSIVNQSDERLKTNIMPSFKDSLGRFNKAQFKWFEYLPDHNLAKGLHHGLIAQEVLKFAPEWVIKEDDGYYTLDHSIMQMDAFKAIQQLSQKVKKLEEQLNGKTI